MKHLAALFCMVCAIALPLQGYAADPGNIYLRYLEGDVQVKTVDANEWLPASINMPLSDSDQIWVPDNGRAELFLRNGTIVRLDRNTFLEMPAPGDNQARLYLGEGRLYGNVVVEKGNAVILETPAASFIARTNSAFRIDVAENEDTAASVLQGELYADRGTGQMRIGAGERMALKKDAQYPVLAKLLQADEWEQWNKQRDREFARPELVNTTAYLPDELKSYSYDLNKNGKWVYEQEYGYVWTPTVMVVQEWSPYRVGRWVWMRGDYVWISYEPWGWVPYHYGRWAFIKARGWCWVPPRRGFAYWGPGYVGWVHTPTCVSWVPLAPREVYYGRGYYGPYSVNIKNVTVQNITVNRPAYKNIHVNNAITAVHRDTFVAGRQVKPTPKENLFLKERKIMAAPEIRPEKATLMPVVKDIPKAKQPPARIASLESGTSNQLKRTDERRAGMPQRTYNAPAGPRKENPATGSQAVQRISRPPTQSSRTSLQRGTPRGNEVPSTTGQLTSTRYVRTESQRIGAVNKAPAAPVARQET
ncbi:MAG TPA: FecR family protein, partial [Syntrophorhabdaceae bacterium]|nr:FecR family protein [Syntrophorhabdaceae bacterium]